MSGNKLFEFLLFDRLYSASGAGNNPGRGCGCLILFVVIAFLVADGIRKHGEEQRHRNQERHEYVISTDKDTAESNSHIDSNGHYDPTKSPYYYSRPESTMDKSRVEDDDDEYDDEGYNSEGYDRNGYDREGYDDDGYDEDGYDEFGYDEDGYSE